jgi:hypothetical protein
MTSEEKNAGADGSERRPPSIIWTRRLAGLEQTIDEIEEDMRAVEVRMMALRFRQQTKGASR